nr:polyadenylate-binding protein 6-like [Ipomoea batatas]
METLSSLATVADSVTSLSFSLSGSNEAPSLINRRNHLVPIPQLPQVSPPAKVYLPPLPPRSFQFAAPPPPQMAEKPLLSLGLTTTTFIRRLKQFKMRLRRHCRRCVSAFGIGKIKLWGRCLHFFIENELWLGEDAGTSAGFWRRNGGGNADEIETEEFSKYGKVHKAIIMRDEKGKSRGFGFVNFYSHEDAKGAVEGLNGALLGSKQQIFVTSAKDHAS